MSDNRIKELADRFEPYAYAVLRIVAGALFSFHGVQKIVGWHSAFQPPFGSQLWVGGVIELVAGALVAVGAFTRPAAFLSSGQMAVAYIQFHWKLSLADGMWIPVLNKGEAAALYCFLFLFIAAHGAGILSVESFRERGRAGGGLPLPVRNPSRTSD